MGEANGGGTLAADGPKACKQVCVKESRVGGSTCLGRSLTHTHMVLSPNVLRMARGEEKRSVFKAMRLGDGACWGGGPRLVIVGPSEGG